MCLVRCVLSEANFRFFAAADRFRHICSFKIQNFLLVAEPETIKRLTVVLRIIGPPNQPNDDKQRGVMFSLYLLKLERRLNPQEKGRGGGGGATVPPVGGLYIQYTLKFQKRCKRMKILMDKSELSFCEAQVCCRISPGFRRSEFKKCVLPRLHRRFKAQELKMGVNVFVQDSGPEKLQKKKGKKMGRRQ